MNRSVWNTPQSGAVVIWDEVETLRATSLLCLEGNTKQLIIANFEKNVSVGENAFNGCKSAKFLK